MFLPRRVSRVLRCATALLACAGLPACALFGPVGSSDPPIGTAPGLLDVATTDFPTVTLDDDLDFAMRQFGKSNIEEIPVVDAEDPSRPLGTLVRLDVINAYNRAMLSEDLAGGVSSRMQASVQSQVTETLGGFVLNECVVPYEMQGKTLRELDFRSRFNTQVVLVCSKDAGGTSYELPESDTVLRSGDRILLFGSRQDVAKVRNL